jgi:hypothetical protein
MEKNINLNEYWGIINDPKNKNKKKTLLIGNGLGLAHTNSTIEDIFRFKIDEEDIEKFIDLFILSFKQKLQEHKKRILGPEVFLQAARNTIIQEILDPYICKFTPEKIDEIINNPNLINFIMKFNSIFTTNYDIATYRLFQPLFNPQEKLPEKPRFIDGFFDCTVLPGIPPRTIN